MADFDAILKEVQALRDEHLSLQVLIPKLAEEAKGLRLSISDAQRELSAIEEQQQAIKDKTTDTINGLYDRLEAKVNLQEEKEAKFTEATQSINRLLDQRTKENEDRKLELDAKEIEVSNLLAKQVDGDKALQKALIDLDKRIGDTLLREAKVEREAQELEDEKDKVCALVLSLSDEQARLATERTEVDSMTREAQALLTAAHKKHNEVKDQNDILQLRIDEYNRKDELLKDSGKRLRKREIAINDKERVYNSR